MKTDTIDKQIEQKRNWVTHPTRRYLVISLTVWFVGIVFLVITMTDFFTQSFFNKKHFVFYAMIIMSTWTTIKVTLNYIKTKEHDDKKNKK